MDDVKLISLNRKNQETLHGGLVGDGNNLAVHIHGSWGNFYENPFVFSVATEYSKAGYKYISFNTPGHDQGTINEKFDDSFQAIVDWCEQHSDSNSKIVLQGHSLGALKIIRMAQLDEFAEFFGKVAGIVLLSPFDLVGFYGGRNSERRRAHAKEFRDQFGEKAILPNTIFDTWPISAETFLELSEPGSEYDLFPSRLGNVDPVSKLGKPALVVLGSEDVVSDPTPEDVMTAIEATKAKSEFIQGAPHNFAGFEIELGKIISRFISEF